MADKIKKYRFKYVNVDLESYRSNLRQKAVNLRLEADVLLTRAKQIEEISSDLLNDLIEVSEEE